eukprot:m51a1_g13662 hypothetical protein (148) ;mRNA; f:1239-1855
MYFTVEQFRAVVKAEVALSLALVLFWTPFLFAPGTFDYIHILWEVWLIHALLGSLAWAATFFPSKRRHLSISYAVLQVLQMCASVAAVQREFGTTVFQIALEPQIVLLCELPLAVLMALFVTSVVMAVHLEKPPAIQLAIPPAAATP